MFKIDFADIEMRAMAEVQSIGRLERKHGKAVSLAQAYGMGDQRLNSVMRGDFLKIVGTVEDWYRLQTFVALTPGLVLELRPKPAGKRKQLIGKVRSVYTQEGSHGLIHPLTRHEHTFDELVARVEPAGSKPDFTTGGTVSTRSIGPTFGGQIKKKSRRWNQVVADEHFKLGSV